MKDTMDSLVDIFNDALNTAQSAIKDTGKAIKSRVKSTGKWIGNSAMSGLGSFNVGLTETADVILGKPLQELGWENNPISKVNRYYEKEYEKYKTKAYEAAEELGGKGYKFGADAIAGLTSAVPHVILALMTKGTSLSGSVTTSGLQSASAAATGNILTKAGVTVEKILIFGYLLLSLTEMTTQRQKTKVQMMQSLHLAQRRLRF